MLFESRSQSLAKSPCHDCLDENSRGVFRYEGCEKKFCLKHTNEHRSMLKAHLNELAEGQHEFFNEIKGQKPISTMKLAMATSQTVVHPVELVEFYLAAPAAESGSTPERLLLQTIESVLKISDVYEIRNRASPNSRNNFRRPS